MKDKNKVKSILYRFILSNRDSERKNFRVTIKKGEIDNILRLNCFLPKSVLDLVESNDNINFFNFLRIRNDLPFLKRNDVSISIDMGH